MNIASLDKSLIAPVGEFFLRLGDDALIMGSRLAEWCGHGPILEEDIALSNISLDCLGHAVLFLRTAGQIEGKGRDEDALAYLRNEREFKNLQFVEQKNGDFAKTIAKIFLFSAYTSEIYSALSTSPLEELSALAAKSLKETKYHLRHSAEWLIRFGDGTEESKRRLMEGLNSLWGYTAEFFEDDEVTTALVGAQIMPALSSLAPKWVETVDKVFAQAMVIRPREILFRSRGSRTGIHSEHLGHMLAEMQHLVRSFPGARW